MTIAFLPRRANAIGRFARLSSAVREGALPQPTTVPAVNEGRWATLPGEYTGPRARPLDRTLPAITAPGISEPVACAGFGPVTIHLAGTWVGRVAFEGSTDGVTWSRLTLTWKSRIDQRITELERLKDSLTECIGCGCLSLDRCRLANPSDRAAHSGPGPRYWIGDTRTL